MPYKSVQQAEKKNKGLLRYSEKAKKVWLEVFNKTMDRYNDESRAFASAYSVANKIDGKSIEAGEYTHIVRELLWTARHVVRKDGECR